MAHHIRLDPQIVNEIGVANSDSTVLPEFSFHHGHVDRICNTMDDLVSYGVSFTNTPTSVSQMILVKPTFEGTLQSGYLKNSLPCRPLLRGFSDSITRGDSVIYTKIGNNYYYLGPLNTTNNPNYTPDTFNDPNINPSLKERILIDDRKDDVNGYNKNYRKINVDKVFKQKKYDLDSPHNTRLGEIGSDAELESIFSDMVFEGRHNNSIQIGSRFVNPYITIKNNSRITNVIDGEEKIKTNNGSVIGLLSLGSINEFFEGYSVLSSDKRIGEEYQDIQEGQYPGYRINFGNDEIGEPREDVFNIEYGRLQESPSNQTEFDQVIMFSDRITFDSKKEDLTMSAYRNINFGAGRNVTITNKGFSVIESQNIYLGKQSKTKTEPMVLGEELRKVLQDMMNIIKNAHALVQGVPLPLVDSSGAPLQLSTTLVEAVDDITTHLTRLQEREKDEESGIFKDGDTTFLSKHHFIEINRRQNEG